MAGKKRAFIITDKPLFDLGYTAKITNILEPMGIQYQIFSDVRPDPDLKTINKAKSMLDTFNPDLTTINKANKWQIRTQT